MAKNAIFQYYLGYNGVGKPNTHFASDSVPDWAEPSVESFQKYAELHDADYYFFDDRYIGVENHFEQLRAYMDPMFDQYDKVLYLDVDVMPKNMSANIFEVEFADIAGWSEWRNPALAVSINYKSPSIRRRYADFGAPYTMSSRHPNDVRMINTGVLLWSKEARLKARESFDDPEKWFTHKNPVLDPKFDSKVVGHSSHCLDQVYLNAMLNKFNFKVTELPLEWNRLPTKDENYPCNFAHYVGDYRFKIPEYFKDIK